MKRKRFLAYIARPLKLMADTATQRVHAQEVNHEPTV